MITLKQTKEEILVAPNFWKIPLMNFVDDFRYYKNPSAIAEPFPLSDKNIDAVLASTAETLCDEMKLEIPEWLNDIPVCDDPFFVAGLENLKAATLVQSPLRFRLRKIFVLKNFLSRV